ncbi:MAG: imidazolonepropionase [Chloroflexota bacterium]
MAAAPLLLHGSGRCFDGARIRVGWALLTDADGRIAWMGGTLATAPSTDADRIDLGEALVTPGLVDSHTHPVFAGDRADEAAARHDGVAYGGGGILRTVRQTRAASDEELEALVRRRLDAALAAGTTTVECKSGYGLSTHEELRALRLLGRVAASHPVRVVRTLLGAHAVPPEAASADAHVEVVCREMIPAAAADGLAEYVDVFCDRGFFNIAHLERIAAAATDHGLGLRLHADQLGLTGAAQAGVRLGAASVDHLEQLDAAGVAALAGSATVATLLPAPAIVLRDSLPPARALLDAGATVALASDANAGTYGGWGAMPLVIGLGSALLEMSAIEALTAATGAAAQALGRAGLIGTLAPGARADLVAWDATHEGAFWLTLGRLAPRRTFIGGRESTST